MKQLRTNHKYKHRYKGHEEYWRRIINWGEKYGVAVLCPDLEDISLLKKSIEDFVDSLRLPKGLEREITISSISYVIRESYMAYCIEEEIKKGNYPLVAVVGSAHGLPYRTLPKVLKERNIPFINLCQSNHAKGSMQHLEKLGKYFS